MIGKGVGEDKLLAIESDMRKMVTIKHNHKTYGQ